MSTKLGPPPPNLLKQYTPPNRKESFIQGMDHLATSMDLELTDEQLSCACAWFLSHPELGMRYLQELKEEG